MTDVWQSSGAGLFSQTQTKLWFKLLLSATWMVLIVGNHFVIRCITALHTRDFTGGNCNSFVLCWGASSHRALLPLHTPQDHRPVSHRPGGGDAPAAWWTPVSSYTNIRHTTHGERPASPPEQMRGTIQLAVSLSVFLSVSLFLFFWTEEWQWHEACCQSQVPGSPPGCKISISGVRGLQGIFHSFLCGWRFSQLERPAARSAPQPNTDFFLFSPFAFSQVCFFPNEQAAISLQVRDVVSIVRVIIVKQIRSSSPDKFTLETSLSSAVGAVTVAAPCDDYRGCIHSSTSTFSN